MCCKCLAHVWEAALRTIHSFSHKMDSILRGILVKYYCQEINLGDLLVLLETFKTQWSKIGRVTALTKLLLQTEF